MVRSALKLLILALILLSTSCMGEAKGVVSKPPTMAEQHAWSVVLMLEDSKHDYTCTGTIIGPHTIKTARHCFQEGQSIKTLVLVNSFNVKASAPRYSKLDVAEVDVDITFTSWAKEGPAMQQGDHLHWWGNPLGMPNYYREGYVSTILPEGANIVGLSCEGDSGSGLFNEQGQLVGVLAGGIWAMDSKNYCSFVVIETPSLKSAGTRLELGDPAESKPVTNKGP